MDNGRKNIVDISGSLNHSPVTINQNQDDDQSITNRHVEYVIDEGTVRVFPQKPADQMNALFLITLIVSGLGILADMLGVLSYLGLQERIAFLILAPICWLVALITRYDRWLTSLKDDGTAAFKGGLWYEKLPDGNFVSYIKRAKCIYPKCEGLIQIVPAPLRERPNHTLVGKCSVGGVRHTYTVDYNGIGYPREFDWRPLSQEKKASL